jgi:AcrR family transcriptional regulator
VRRTGRAGRQAGTRQRIVEAAVDLHGTIGPARTTVTMVAERAGVQRHTFYKHFPDERSLLMACSGLAMERDPLPDADPWHEIEGHEARLRTALGAHYAWYGRNAGLMACVLRDAQQHPLVREVSQLRAGPVMAAYAELLGRTLGPLGRAALGLALGFAAWSALVREAGLSEGEAVTVMVRAILAADGQQPPAG